MIALILNGNMQLGRQIDPAAIQASLFQKATKELERLAVAASTEGRCKQNERLLFLQKVTKAAVRTTSVTTSRRVAKVDDTLE